MTPAIVPAGVPARRYDNAEIVALYASGKSSLQVADTLGISKACVLRKVRAAGLVRSLREAFKISPTHGMRLKVSGAECLSWRGGKKKHSDGYLQVMVKGHPFADQFGYVLEHRLIKEREIGRYLLPTEDVHHDNEVRDDNRAENLILLSHSKHVALHAAKRARHLGRFV